MDKYKTTQVWEVKVHFEDPAETNEGVRMIRRDAALAGIVDGVNNQFIEAGVEAKLVDEGIQAPPPAIPVLEDRALSIVYDLVMDDDGLAGIVADITTRVCGGYDARAEDADDMSAAYSNWYSTYTNVLNRVFAKFMHGQFYPRDFS